ncbi:MAG: hypothetical protein EBQ96_00850 [Proteobacteria bacterium]|nr:hypothetical protein [Pseudomonadota bacterium]
MTTSTKPSNIPVWQNISYIQIDDTGRPLADGQRLDCPVLLDRDLPDPAKPIRIFVSVPEGDGFYSQECIGPRGYYYSDGAGCVDTSHEFSPLARHHYYRKSHDVTAILTFEKAAAGEIAVLTHLRQGETHVRRFLRQGPAQQI